MSDLISRGKLFNLLAPVQTLGEAYGIIQGMETVDAVTVRHGRWETVEDWDGDERYKCSVCGDEWFLEVGNPEFNNMNYCPKCGARMDGKGNGNETD